MKALGWRRITPPDSLRQLMKDFPFDPMTIVRASDRGDGGANFHGSQSEHERSSW